MAERTDYTIRCPECGTRAAVDRQTNGRLYFNCRDGCKAHHRFDPDARRPERLPAVFDPQPAGGGAPAQPAAGETRTTDEGEHGGDERNDRPELRWI